jgi:hypothetical protein
MGVLTGSIVASQEMLTFFRSAVPRSWSITFHDNADRVLSPDGQLLDDGQKPFDILVVAQSFLDEGDASGAASVEVRHFMSVIARDKLS